MGDSIPRLDVVNIGVSLLTVGVSFFAFIFSVVALTITLYYQYWQVADVRLSIGQDILINSRPRIGFMCSFYNSGARAGIVTRGKLLWDDSDDAGFSIAMISPRFEAWQYVVAPSSEGEKQARRAPGEATTFSYLSPLVIKPREAQSAVLWFTSLIAEQSLSGALFAPGEHSVELRLYSNVSPEPVTSRKCYFSLSNELSEEINAKGQQAFEIPVRLDRCD